MKEESVGIAELKSRLSEYLRKVRGGRAIVVLDRDRPIARIEPYGSERVELVVRRPAPNAPALHRVPLPPPLDLRIDVVDLLLEERQGER